MKRIAPLAALAGAAALAALTLALFFVAAGTYRNADSARDGARTLFETRVRVAEAQERIGDSDLGHAIATAGRANKAAEKVGAITARVARLLETTRVAARTITDTSRSGVQTVAFTRRQTASVTLALRAISRYQANASGSARVSNRALARILRALRQTNEEFPGR